MPLILAANLPAFLGARDEAFIVPEGVPPTQPLYAHVASSSNECACWRGGAAIALRTGS